MTIDAEEKRPTVQVGDPFAEKLLLEACLEIMAKGLRHRDPGHGRGGPHLLGGRDGREGRSRHRTASRQGADRETGMTAYEMMLSESQERMLMVLKPERGKAGRGDLQEVGPRLRRRRLHHADTALRGEASAAR
jgi:hypothetical protein